LSVTPLPEGESGGRVVQLAGRLDAGTAAELRAALWELDRESRAGDLVLLDLSRVEQVDAVGLAPLVLGQRRATARSYAIALMAPSEPVVTLLARTHLTATFRSVARQARAQAQPA
jgi:anti-anti-sigma factor